MTISEIVMSVAMVTGPIAAGLIVWALEKRRVLIVRALEKRRVQRERRMDIFRTLMRTRTGSARLSPDHVAALNLIEIEFRNDSDVRDAWKEHFKILCQLGSNPNVDLRLSRENSLAKLLRVMSRILGYEIEGLEILEGGYTPQSDADWHADWHLIRRYVIALSRGEGVLPVKVPESIPGGLLTPPQDR